MAPESLLSLDFHLEPVDNMRLANLCGQFDEHLRLMEQRLGVEINNRGEHFQVIGDQKSAEQAGDILERLYQATANEVLSPRDIHLVIRESGMDDNIQTIEPDSTNEVIIKTRKGMVRGRGENQKQYLNNIVTHDINIGIGPAGTGKTYLAVACAVEALEKDQVRRVILTRPAVEAGERLGFLPGDLAQKIDPYLRPLYDALYEMLGFERVAKLVERNVIEIAPLAYMRGRTLNEAFIILDEAQNTTLEQMKMFLTRIGFGSTAVVTGDITQVDLPGHTPSGLRQVVDVLKGVDGISFSFFKARDVVRHELVQRIVSAYDRYDRANELASVDAKQLNKNHSDES